MNKRAKWKKIGIIGGFGPRASGYFYNTLINICSSTYGSVQDNDYPEIHFISMASDGLSETGVVKASLIKEIDLNINKLVSQNIDFIAIPCNSIFALGKSLEKYWGETIINLPRILSERVIDKKREKVVVLCSSGLRKSRAYDEYFLEKGIQINYPNESVQLIVDSLILNVMGGLKIQQSRDEFISVIKNFHNSYGSIVVACTELSLLTEQSGKNSSLVDCCEVLAEEILSRALF